MTTITLSTLRRQRDASIAYRPGLLTRLRARLPRLTLRPVTAGLLVILAFAIRHGLVLAGCCAAVIAAATLSATAAWIMTALALFFLEARRR